MHQHDFKNDPISKIENVGFHFNVDVFNDDVEMKRYLTTNPDESFYTEPPVDGSVESSIHPEDAISEIGRGLGAYFQSLGKNKQVLSPFLTRKKNPDEYGFSRRNSIDTDFDEERKQVVSTMLGSNEVDKTFFIDEQPDMNVKVMKDIVCALEQAVTA